MHVVSQNKVQQAFWFDDGPDDSGHYAAHHNAAEAGNQVTQNS